jgi:hypothetical protein
MYYHPLMFEPIHEFTHLVFDGLARHQALQVDAMKGFCLAQCVTPAISSMRIDRRARSACSRAAAASR